MLGLQSVGVVPKTIIPVLGTQRFIPILGVKVTHVFSLVFEVGSQTAISMETSRRALLINIAVGEVYLENQ